MPIVPHSLPGLSTPSETPAAAALGIYGRNVSTASQWAKGDAIIRRFALQAAARSLLPREAVSRCYRWLRPAGRRNVDIADTGTEITVITPRAVAVDVLYSPENQAGLLGGLETCRSVWHCPVCSAKITERRRVELAQGLHNWYGQEQPGRVLLVTFTMQHTQADGLRELMQVLTRARRLLLTGRWWQSFRERHQLVGQVRALEVTVGENGWHPHLHCLFFFAGEVDWLVVRDELKARWAFAVRRVGTGRWASLAHGVDVRYSREDVADYVAKYGYEPSWAGSDPICTLGAEGGWSTAHEMTKNPVKLGRAGGRTPMQLLADYMAGDLKAGLLWQRYALVMKGQRQLFWTPHLRAQLGLGVELTDEELADEQDAMGILLARLTPEQWRVVLANDARGELMNAAATGDVEVVRNLLRDLGADLGDDLVPFMEDAA